MKLKELFELSFFSCSENNDVRIYTHSNCYTYEEYKLGLNNIQEREVNTIDFRWCDGISTCCIFLK